MLRMQVEYGSGLYCFYLEKLHSGWPSYNFSGCMQMSHQHKATTGRGDDGAALVDSGSDLAKRNSSTPCVSKITAVDAPDLVPLMIASLRGD